MCILQRWAKDDGMDSFLDDSDDESIGSFSDHSSDEAKANDEDGLSNSDTEFKPRKTRSSRYVKLTYVNSRSGNADPF